MAVSPRHPKGPPLNALRAFEAAARLESFVAAGEELGVTAGAVSQHIKSLEDWAGTKLFERNVQGVALSSSGRKLTNAFTAAFDQLAAATQSLRTLAPNPDLHIAALPSVAQLWLPARLSRLRELHPDLNVSVTAMERPPSLSREFFDLSIFFAEPMEMPDQIVLETDTIFPVCSPNIANGLDLKSAPLLHDQTWQTDWPKWTAETGVSVGDPKSGQRYSLYALAVEEAKSGAGVLMGHSCLIGPALRSGQLVRLSPEECGTGLALVIELPHRSRRHPEINTIVALLQEKLDRLES